MPIQFLFLSFEAEIVEDLYIHVLGKEFFGLNTCISGALVMAEMTMHCICNDLFSSTLSQYWNYSNQCLHLYIWIQSCNMENTWKWHFILCNLTYFKHIVGLVHGFQEDTFYQNMVKINDTPPPSSGTGLVHVLFILLTVLPGHKCVQCCEPGYCPGSCQPIILWTGSKGLRDAKGDPCISDIPVVSGRLRTEWCRSCEVYIKCQEAW